MRGTQLAIAIQVRPINKRGTAFTGRWVTTKDLRWTAQRRDVAKVRAPKKIGGYALRVAATRVSRSAAADADHVSAAGTGVIATSAPTALATQPKNCAPLSEDGTIIEYFNEVNFTEGFVVTVIDGDVEPQATAPGTFAVRLSCPAEESPEIPGPDFQLTLTLAGGSQSSTCSHDVNIVLNKTDITDTASCRSSTCEFTVVLSNKTTGQVYSLTETSLTLDGNQTIVPNLNPATIPICRASYTPCVLTGTCQD